MKKLRLISALIALILAFNLMSAKVIAAESNNFAAYVHGQATIYSQAYVKGNLVAEGNFSLDGNEPIREGTLYYDESQSGNPTLSKVSNPLLRSEYLGVLPFGGVDTSELPDFPTDLPEKSVGYENPVISESGKFSEININPWWQGIKNLTIDVPDGKTLHILIENLNMNTGNINIQGNGTVIFYVKNMTTSNSCSINNVGNANASVYVESNVSLNLHGDVDFYSKNANIIINNTNGQTLKSNIYTNGSVTVYSNNKIQGNIYAGSLTINPSSNITGYVVTDGLTTINSGAYIRGIVEAGSLTINGYIEYADVSGGISDVYQKILSGDFEEPEEPENPDYINGILGEYYSSPTIFLNDSKLLHTDANSTLKLQRIDPIPMINIRPDNEDDAGKFASYGMDTEQIAVRWSGYIKADKTGNYTFKTLSDDGVRLWVDGNLLIDRIGLVNLEYTTADDSIILEAGEYYPIVMDYQQFPLSAFVALFWETDDDGMEVVPPNALYVEKSEQEDLENSQGYNASDKSVYVSYTKDQGTGLTNKFYLTEENMEADEEAEFTETNLINYQFGLGAPGGISNDVFYGRMEGYIEPKHSGQMTLHFEVDDAIKVWIDDDLKIDQWSLNSREVFEADINVTAGEKLSIKIYYADFGVGATCVMRWVSDLQKGEVVPLKYLYSK